MKRYWLFGGDDYYPQGGMYDLVSRHDTVRDAMAAGRDTPDGERPLDWWHVWDAEEGVRVVQDSDDNTLDDNV